MGNSQSSTPTEQTSSTSRSPGPGSVHPSLRQKKKSLELPDLALALTTQSPYSGYRGRSPAPPKSASIPIPGNADGRQRTPRDKDRDRDRDRIRDRDGEGGRGTQTQEVFAVQPSSTMEAHLNPSTRKSAKERDRERESPHRRGRPRVAGYGYTYGYVPSNLSLVTTMTTSSNSNSETLEQNTTSMPNAPPPSLSASPALGDVDLPSPLVVRSSLPLALPRTLTHPTSLALQEEDEEEEIEHVEHVAPRSRKNSDRARDESGEADESEADVMTKISWRGGGYKVFLARAGDNDWRGRTEMLLESSPAPTQPPIFATTIPLPPGTHYFRYLVDDQWRVSDDYQAAVDETGNLTNYLEVFSSEDHSRKNSESRESNSGKDREMGVVQSTTSRAREREREKGSSSRTRRGQPGDSPGEEDIGKLLSLDLPTPGETSSTTPGTITGISPSGSMALATPVIIHSNADGFPLTSHGHGNGHGHSQGQEIGLGIDLAAVGTARVVEPHNMDDKVPRVRPPGYGYGYSFWSGSSTNDGEVEVVGGPGTSPESASSMRSSRGKESGEGGDEEGKKGRCGMRAVPLPPGGGGGKGKLLSKAKSKSKVKYDPRWTTEIPLELVEAAREEEDYLAWQAENNQNHGRGSHTRVNGFVPVPNIPPAPGLPRYLDKLILNTPSHPRNVIGLGGLGSPVYTTVPPPSSSMENGDTRRTLRERKSRDKDRLGLSTMAESVAEDVVASLPLPITTASGTDVTAAIPEGLPKVFHGHVQRHASHSHSHHNGSTLAVLAVPTTLPAHALELQGDIHIADDPSMLPVPSHVVIHHLCTSAIRNGVLAIGETVRYRKKFVTTVYYKPAS